MASAEIDYLTSLCHWAQSCRQLQAKGKHHSYHHPTEPSPWKLVCIEWKKARIRTEDQAKAFFEQNFQKSFQVKDETLITGYYAPTFHACWQQQPYCEVPILGWPDQKKLRQLSRREINGLSSDDFPIIAWTSRVDRYFLQIQGSGKLLFNSGDEVYVGYAGKNGLPYASIGQYLYESKQLQKHDLDMPGILHYLNTHLTLQQSIFEKNASFVFFKIKPTPEVIGLLGSQLHKELSAAVDTQSIPLGSLIKVHTTNPITHKTWDMLLTAEDTGSAIRGRHHIDVYMGEGEEAGKLAGAMKQGGQITYYLPAQN